MTGDGDQTTPPDPWALSRHLNDLSRSVDVIRGKALSGMASGATEHDRASPGSLYLVRGLAPEVDRQAARHLHFTDDEGMRRIFASIEAPSEEWVAVCTH